MISRRRLVLSDYALNCRVDRFLYHTAGLWIPILLTPRRTRLLRSALLYLKFPGF